MTPKFHRLHPKSLTALSSSPPAAIPIAYPSSASFGRPPATSTARPRSQDISTQSHYHAASIQTISERRRAFSSLDRPPPLYPGHVPITLPERIALALSSTIWSALSPRRADLIALCSETTTPLSLLDSLRNIMLTHPSGRSILRTRPRISTSTVSIPHLRSLPAGTLGAVYVKWLETENVTPDTRDPVKHVPDEELAFVLQRYRESHDFCHVLLAEKGMPSFLEGEVVVKAFEFAALGLPMTGMAMLSAAKLKGPQRRRVLLGGEGGAGDVPAIENHDGEGEGEGKKSSSGSKGGEPWLLWAIRQGLNTRDSEYKSLLNVYWEKEWETPLSELRRRLGIELPPGVGDLREIRQRAKEKRKRVNN